MGKRNNMGRKSHHAQDAQFNQNTEGFQDEIKSNQPTRPSIGQQQADKSSKEEPRNTK